MSTEARPILRQDRLDWLVEEAEKDGSPRAIIEGAMAMIEDAQQFAYDGSPDGDGNNEDKKDQIEAATEYLSVAYNLLDGLRFTF
jgi:hypothetical protein